MPGTNSAAERWTLCDLLAHAWSGASDSNRFPDSARPLSQPKRDDSHRAPGALRQLCSTFMRPSERRWALCFPIQGLLGHRPTTLCLPWVRTMQLQSDLGVVAPTPPHASSHSHQPGCAETLGQRCSGSRAHERINQVSKPAGRLGARVDAACMDANKICPISSATEPACQ